MISSTTRAAIRLLVCLAISGCLCSDQVTSEATSPDGMLTATVFVRNCGATTDFVSKVSLHPKLEGFKDERTLVFVAHGGQPISASWKGPRSLTVECTGCARPDVSYQVTTVGDIDILYLLGSSSAAPR